MVRFFLCLACSALLCCGVVFPADYVVNLEGNQPLDAVPDTNHDGGSGDLDATMVADGDSLTLDNLGSATVSSQGPRLTVAGNGTLRIGTASTAGGIAIDLKENGVAGDMTVGDANGAGLVVIGGAADQAVGITGRKLSIIDGDIVYANQTAIINLTFEQFAFANGTFTMGGDNGYLSITGSAVIGNGEGTATFIATGDGRAQFNAGLEVTAGGVLTRDGSATTTAIDLGASGALRLTGGEIRNDSDGELVFKSSSVTVEGTEKSTIIATGSGGITFGNGTNTAITIRQDLDIIGVDLGFATWTQTAGTVVADGGSVTVSGAASLRGATASFAGEGNFLAGLTVSGGATLGGRDGANTVLSAGSGSSIDVDSASFVDVARSSVILGSDTAMNLSGTLLVGGSGNVLDASAGRVNFDGGTVIRVADAYRSDVSEGQVVVSAAGLETVRGFSEANARDDHFLLGEFHFAQAEATDGTYTEGDIYVSKAVAGEALDGSDYDRVRDRIVDRYGPLVNSDGFIENIYKSVSNAPDGHPLAALIPDIGVVEGSGSPLEQSYLMNLANFQAFASAGAATRNGSLAALYSGYNNSGVAEIAISTSNAAVSRISDHVRLNNTIRARMREVCDSDTVGAESANSYLGNHFWAGAFGIFEDVETRKGYAGHRYDAGGVITGYDYVSGSVTVGGAFAYARGDYADKTGMAHDSTIASYSFAIHGTWNACNGGYVTGSAAYTYSSNDIGEYRSDASSAAGAAWNRADYHGNTYNIGIEAGYDHTVAGSLVVTPSIGLRHIRTRTADHTEYLGGVAAGRIRGLKDSVTSVPVRVDLGWVVPTGTESSLRFNLGAAYRYTFDTDSLRGSFTPDGFANASVHSVIGRPKDRHAYGAGGGFRFTADRFDIGLQYEYSASTTSRIHHVVGTAGIHF